MGNLCCPQNKDDLVAQVEEKSDQKMLVRPQASLQDVRVSLSTINISGPQVEVEMVDRCTIQPAPIDEETKGIFDYTAFVDIEEIEPTVFKIKHKNDSTKDVEVTIEIEEEEQSVYWTGLPRAANQYMQDFDFGTQSKHPFVCLKMMLN